MTYIFDCNSFLELEAYYPVTFPSFWERFNDLVAEGRVLSVSEAFKELNNQARSEHLIDWLEANQTIFTPPSPPEQQYVSEIFAVPHFRQLVGRKQLERGMPVADPFLVAKGRHLGACVVSEETAKPNSAKIPNVCGHFGVECVKLRSVFEREGWRF